MYKAGDLVWVCRGLSSKSQQHEEPAIVMECEDDAVTVKYTTAGYMESIDANRVRPMKDERRSRAVAVVTPPVATAASLNAADDEDDKEEQEEMQGKTKDGDNFDDGDDDEPIVKFASAASIDNKRKRVGGENDDIIIVRTSDDDDDKPGEESNNGNEISCGGVGYFVEYSKTSRATCRRCDLPIEKGQMRVGHKPLFRGQQGFVVYRHLHCAVFPTHLQEGYQLQGYEHMNAQHQKDIDLRLQESVKEVQEENAEIQPDELLIPSFQGEMRPAPPGLVVDLLPFQVEGQSWMFAQEHTSFRGGILADEMGMGKTIQTIATILDHRPKLQHCTQSHPKCSPDASESYRLAVVQEQERWDSSEMDWKHEMKMQNVPNKILPKQRLTRGGTLVVCPVIALSQWKSEIDKFCHSNVLTVVIYHGPHRTNQTPKALLAKYDVVLTTYQVLEADFRRMVSPNKVKCPNCGKGFKLDKLRIHLKYFCGEAAQRTEAQARQRRTAERHITIAQRPTTDNRNSKTRSTRNPNDDENGKKKVFLTEQANRTRTSSTRKAAVIAKKSLLKSKLYKETEDDVDKDEDYTHEEESSFSEGQLETSSSSSSSLPTNRDKKIVARRPLNSKKVSTYSSDEKTSEEERNDEDSVALEKQRQALEHAQSKGGRFNKLPVKTNNKVTSKKTQLSRNKFVRHSSLNDEDSDDDRVAIAKQRDALEKLQTKNNGRKRTKKSAQKKHSSNCSSSAEDDDSFIPRSEMDDIDMEAMVEEAMAGCSMSQLHSISWWRIVLDEAHFIKSRSSQTAAAAFALIGIHRWALSGTPLQNRVGEMYSLIRYLRIDPMAHYFCRSKNCNCKSLHYRMMNGKCQDCGHGSVQHFSHFNKYVLNPIQRCGYSGDGRRAMFTLKNEVLDKCLLRRTKETRAEDLTLPQRIVTVRYVKMHPVEEDFYEALYTQGKSSFDDYVADGTLLNNYAHIFDLLMRMRQAVDHPYLVVFSNKGTSTASDVLAVCSICNEDVTGRVLSSCCQTAFCRSCVIEYMATSAGLFSTNTPCPSCRAPFSIDLNSTTDTNDLIGIETNGDEKKGSKKVSSVGMPSLRDLPHVATGSILRRMNLAEFSTSSKIEVLTEELVQMRKESPGSKAIVFSQFVNMLDLIRWRIHSDPFLANLGLGCRALHGSMNVEARDTCLKDFREDPNIRVLLMSLKAGGVALNLTVANYIYLMDPWWNPAAEMQAIDRTHRLGQHRAIRAVRFIAENTVEERILQLQEKKRLVFDGTVGRDAASLKMLTVDDMKSLFT